MPPVRKSSSAAALVTAALSFGLIGACQGEPEGSIDIVVGEEADAFSRAPAPVLLVAEKVTLDGARQELARATLPTDSLSLGKLPRTDVGSIAVSALDPSGKPLLRGETLLVQWGAIELTPLEVFTQRTGELARMPRGPVAFETTQLTILVGRYVLATNGGTTTTTTYDLLRLRTLDPLPALPRPPKSVAAVGTTALIVDETGATTFDVSDGTTAPLAAPVGGTFAEVAGGERTDARDGAQFIVGATRTSGGVTPRILSVDSQGNATFAALTVPREGACAAWVDGRGLIVIGGGDGAAPGAEILAPNATVATPLPFPPEPVRGCAATALDNGHVLVVGGSGAAGTIAPPRVYDLACTGSCTPSPWPDAIPLVRAQATSLGAGAAFVVGDDATGATHAIRAAATGGLREVPLRVPRRNARMIPTPTGGLAVLGGGAGIELYRE